MNDTPAGRAARRAESQKAQQPSTILLVDLNKTRSFAAVVRQTNMEVDVISQNMEVDPQLPPTDRADSPPPSAPPSAPPSDSSDDEEAVAADNAEPPDPDPAAAASMAPAKRRRGKGVKPPKGKVRGRKPRAVPAPAVEAPPLVPLTLGQSYPPAPPFRRPRTGLAAACALASANGSLAYTAFLPPMSGALALPSFNPRPTDPALASQSSGTFA
jgi:hypothetical protein